MKIRITKYQEGTQEVNNDPIPIQTEKNEWISLPDNTLIPVKAKESHKKQDKDNVTDIAPPGSFIYSADKKLTIDKTKTIKGIKLDDISFGYTPVEYLENEITPSPKEIKFIDIMNKNKMTPAQIAAQVYAKYPSTDREKDAFSISANEQNKLSRTPYLAVLQELNKRKQTKQPQQYRYGGPVQHFQEGGDTSNYATPPEAFSNMVINQTEAKYNDTLKTAGDPYEYRQLKDGSYQTKKRTASTWINMNENQTSALNKQIEAGIFDANYKPKNVKPAATVKTKQELDKHDNKVTPYTSSNKGYAFTRDFNDPTRTEINNSTTRLNIQYPNVPYVPYSPINNPGYTPVSYVQPINVYNPEQTNNGLVTPTTAAPIQNQPTPTYMNPTFKAALNNVWNRNLNSSASDYYYVNPLSGDPRYGINPRGGASDVVTNNYQQGGMLGMVKNMATKQSSQQPSNKTSGIGGNIMNIMSGLSNQQGNSQGGMYGGIKNMINGMSNQPNNQSMYQPMNTFDSIYNQPTNNAITGLGYKDPMEQRDKAFRNQGMYNSNLYSQPTNTNKQMFNFEQGGYIPHYQQGGNDKVYGGGMWGGLVGSVTDIVTGIFNQVRGDKNAKKSQAELDANKLEQLKTNSSIGNLNMASNLASYASQDPAYEYLNLSNQYARGDNAYQNIGSNLDNAQLAAQNQAMSGSSGFMRNAASLGLSPHQAANYAASMQANAIGNNNQLGLNYANQRGSNIQNQLGYNSRYDDMYSQDQQLGGASVRGNLNKLNSNLIAGVRADGTGKLQADQNIRNNYLANTMGLRNQRYNQMVDQNMMMGNNIKNAFNSGEGLYLNQQARNNYDPRNSYGYTQENPYQIPAGPSSPSTGFNEQNPFNPYAIPYGPR